ncbi:glycosyltransferase family 2 protein [Kitasatospora sp. NPDC092948]|uniref:glycosyltransferase family 2 protein n=1 Tax=Kitasatospora sp. NPDC092948 TaxID=3364088 RepID=UPI003809847D
MTTLDILLPYYGDVSLLQATVRSILAQTDPDWRLTVVDDGREPGVPEWFAELDDDRVTYLRNEVNLGITNNYRKCLGLIEHEYAVMMGPDDIMLPNYVATVRAALAAHPGATLVQPGVEVIDGSGAVVHTLADETKRRLYAPRFQGRRLMQGEELATSLLRGNWLYFPSLVWRTDLVREIGFRDDVEIIQDLALVIDLLQAGGSMVIDDTLCFQYRRHTSSASARTAASGVRFIEARQFFLSVADRLDAQGWSKAARAARWHTSTRLHAITLLPGAVKSGQRAGVKRLLKFATATAKSR